MSSYDEAAVGVDAQLLCRLPWNRPAVHPPAAYRLLRAERPVARALDEAGKPVWLVARYDDVRALLIDHRVSADQSRAGFPLGLHSPAPPESVSFFRMDPPQHTAFRRVLGRSFSARQVETLRPGIQRLVDAHISAMLGHPGRQADFMSELAIPVPSAVLAWILGIGQEDHAAFIQAAADLLRGPDRADPAAPRRALQALSDLRGLVRKWLECKSADPDADADVFGVLLQAVRAGTITMRDAENSGMLFIVAGHETTTSMAALGLYTLLRNPRQRADLSAHPGLLPGAVEELLRYLTVAHLIIRRVAVEDIEIAGVTIRAGEGIYLLNLSANRDDAHFPDASALDIRRDAHDHLAFGWGVHQCIGQSLARLELEIIFASILRRMPTVRLSVPDEELRFKSWSPTNGLFSLPLAW